MAHDTEHVPIPVEVARRIALDYRKSMVVILAYDPQSGLTHTTTYGVEPRDKEQAADVGERCAKLICGDGFARRRSYEDYRSLEAGRNSQARETLTAIENDLAGRLHQRRCFDCGKTHWHAGDTTPLVLCPECRSQDTRRIKQSEETA